MYLFVRHVRFLFDCQLLLMLAFCTYLLLLIYTLIRANEFFIVIKALYVGRIQSILVEGNKLISNHYLDTFMVSKEVFWQLVE